MQKGSLENHLFGSECLIRYHCLGKYILSVQVWNKMEK